MAYGNTVIGLTVISKVILMFFAHKYSTDEDSKSPVHISLNATATSTNQISIRWHLHASENPNIPPIPQLSIQIRNLKDAAKTFDDVTNTTAEKYILNDLENGTDYSVCLMAKNEKRIIGEDCVNVTTFSSSPPEDEKLKMKYHDFVTLSSILGFSCFFGVMMTIYIIYGRVIRSRLQGYTRHIEQQQAQDNQSINNVNTL